MSTYYPSKFQNIGWGTDSTEVLFKIADMAKQTGAVLPLVMFGYVKRASTTCTMFTLSIISRTDGIKAGLKNLGPGSMTDTAFYYKDNGDSISVYIKVKNYVSVLNVFANSEGVTGGKLNSEKLGTTDVSDKILINAV